eukprot:NODE_2166_length_622_cov_314.755672_g1706_i0.p1 GENE.NODE_2166_length_622_cov_314.755672_g1706_i0~~NODE_2166_length_622_cov_314.755672_g1706_i0.p1  ORF type:complete len:133 (-),score=11.94 NODE_2166_length_622_cov_314.755672_g1706_i0:110-508(-)
MAHISGKYELESQENFEKWLVALGVPEAKANLMGKSKTVVEVSVAGTQLTMVYPARPDRAEIKNVITLGQESEVDTPMGKNKVNLAQDGNNLKGTVSGMGKTMNSTFAFSASGFVDTVVLGDVTATRRYKRI